MDWAKAALPSLASRAEDVKTYMARTINPLSPRRRWVTQRSALNAWMYHGRQWIESVGELIASGNAYNFREIEKQSLATYKRPVTNFIAPAVDNEVSRLTKKEYEPEAATSRNHPEWLAAAQLARDIVRSRIAEQAWREKREQLAFNLCIDETAILRTCWDENVMDMLPIGSPDAVVCSSCEGVLASPVLPARFVEFGLPTPGGFAPFMGADSLEEMPFRPGAKEHLVKANTCPLCGQGELRDYDVSEEEAQGQQDALGNPLGQLVPRGEDFAEVVSVHEFYPENGGVGVEPDACRVWNQRSPRPIEEVLQRYPQLENRIQPVNPQEILRLHPLYSDPALVHMGASMAISAGGLDAYVNYVLVDETVVAPQKREGLELGAHFVKVNEELISRPLCVEVEGEGGSTELVPRVRYHVARAKRVPGMFWGRGFVSDLVPLQRRLNELDAQVVDLRERGKPMIWTPMGVELMFRKDTEGSLQVMEYEADTTAWTPRDGLFPGIPMTGNPYMEERVQILRDAQLIGTPQEIELGQNAGIKTTSGMMMASENAGQRREPREKALMGIEEGAYQHILDLQKTFRQEKANYRVEAAAGIYELKSYDAQNLVGSIKIRMKARPGYDEALYNKEAAGEALGMGLYRLDNPVAVQQALRLMRLPDDVNEDQKIQIRRAEMAWTLFIREQKVPFIDEGIYDPVVWYVIFRKRWMDDECLVMQQSVEFDAFMARLAGWQQVLAQAEIQDQQQRAIYGNAPPERWGELYGQAQELYGAAMEQSKQAGMVSAAGQAPPGFPPPPPPPPEEGFLPQQRELRIFTVWERMLGPEFAEASLTVEASDRVGLDISPAAAKVRVVTLLLRMRAVLEALRMLLMAAAAPAPAPAPGPGAQPGAAPSGQEGAPPPQGAAQ